MTSQTETNYSVVPGKAEDAKTIAKVFKEAFVDDVVARNLDARIDPEVLRTAAVKRIVDAFAQAHLTGIHYVMALENKTG